MREVDRQEGSSYARDEKRVERESIMVVEAQLAG
jgi:hypothetical protein